jgi:steroid delta-isomerase-like uncharacterized protein
MSAEQNKTIARRLLEEAWSKGNLAVLDEIVAPLAVDHNPAPGQAPGLEGLKQLITMVREAFPDWSYTIEDMVTEGDKVAIRWIAQGTHRSHFLGIPPTSKQVKVPGINIERIVDGKIVEWWHNFDMLGWLQQLGVVPPPGQAS